MIIFQKAQFIAKFLKNMQLEIQFIYCISIRNFQNFQKISQQYRFPDLAQFVDF